MAKKVTVLSCDDLADLARINYPRHESLALIEGAGASYQFDATSVSEDDGEAVIKPTVRDEEKPGRWLLVPGAGSTPGDWEIQLLSMVPDNTGNYGNDLDSGYIYDPAYEYVFAINNFDALTANIDDLSTIKIIQILPTMSMTITPTVGAGEDEAEGGVPDRKEFHPVDGVNNTASIPNYAYIPAGAALRLRRRVLCRQAVRQRWRVLHHDRQGRPYLYGLCRPGQARRRGAVLRRRSEESRLNDYLPRSPSNPKRRLYDGGS